jgi:biotin-dependent carboxylase-like uncharacterized protein
MIEVVRVGLLATIQDRGRGGWAHLGVPRSGALDLPSLARANRLVGNPDHAAGVESMLRGLAVRTDKPLRMAITGAPCAITINGVSTDFDTVFDAPAEATVVIGRVAAGMRSYVAVAGGLEVPPVLGSRSTDSLSGLGPPPLRAGDRLEIGSMAGGVDPEPAATIAADVTLRIRFGPRDNWFTDDAKTMLTSSPYRLTPLSNRVGARLAGAALARANVAELPSEPLVLGAIQVLPDGQPVVFLADHPTTGGYPVIGVVDERDISRLGQMKPGGAVSFVAAS